MGQLGVGVPAGVLTVCRCMLAKEKHTRILAKQKENWVALSANRKSFSFMAPAPGPAHSPVSRVGAQKVAPTDSSQEQLGAARSSQEPAANMMTYSSSSTHPQLLLLLLLFALLGMSILHKRRHGRCRMPSGKMVN